MEAINSVDNLFTFDDKVTVLVGIELEDEEKIPYFISFYKRTNENQNTREGFLNFDCFDDNNNYDYYNDFIKKNDYLEELKRLKREILTEISKIETIVENQIFWVFCVNSNSDEEKKNKLRLISVNAGLINSSQDKRIMLLEKGIALTSYFEKEKNITIEQGNPYIIIIAKKDFFSFECLEKNYIEGKDQIETARNFFYGKAHFTAIGKILID